MNMEVAAATVAFAADTKVHPREFDLTAVKEWEPGKEARGNEFATVHNI